ncbi:isoleucine--tRNA ligase [Buchnera aphidicola]|uniref:isoleucine--tRNA ligase n=1 Tax=Buchnera aphidicola TaxID=9 RepID=UPI00346493FE
MNIYKKSLNLPKTKFSMRANLIHKEPQIIKKWKKEKIYYNLNKKSKKKKKKFVIHDGPPYANGNIHIGHALNKILKDIILKSKILSGYYISFIPSWDCHGLPIEHQIEKKKNKKKIIKKKIIKKFFRKDCQKYALKQIKNQKKNFIRLGIFADWKNSILTMDYNNQANIMKNLLKIYEKNFLYSQRKPVYWCLKCQSSLAEAEVDHLKKKSHSIIFTMKSESPKKIFKILNIKNKNIKKKSINLLIWTTTPWTIPSNQAISIKPKSLYSFIETKKKIFVISKKLIKKNLEIFKKKKYKIICSILSEKLENLKFFHIFFKKKVKIILSNHVNLDSGTGIVHTSPDHGLEDYIACKSYNIKPINLINSKGIYKDNINKIINKKKIFKCNKIIIKFLKKNNFLIKKSIIKHNYPHCWRHKKPIIFKATKQWFIKLNERNFQKKIIKNIKKIKWIPKWSEKNITKLFLNRPDWCISRQRIWGVPIPLLINKKNGKIHKKNSILVKKIIQKIKLKGIQTWYDFKLKKILNKKDQKKYKKSKDILDVWFDSGCIHNSKKYISINSKKEISDICIEGVDQHRGWFMSSLITSEITQNQKPFKKVLTHGFVIDHHGRKMSKSIGNTIQPNDIIKNYGVEILRLWVASSNYSKDITISKDIIEQISEFYRKIRNTCRFILSNLYDFDPKKDAICQNQMLEIDIWAIKKTQLTQKKIIYFYKKYNFHKLVKYLLKFCSIYMSSFYLDIIKNRQYTMKKNSIGRKSCQTSLYFIIICLSKWISPILSFTADEIWTHIPQKKKNIFTYNWNKNIIKKNFYKKIKFKNWKKIFKIKNEINKILEKFKSYKNIKSSLEIKIILYSKKKLFNLLKILEKELKFIFIVSKVIVKNYYYADQKIKKNKKIKNLKIKIKKYSKKKCQRCWSYSKKIFYYKKYKKICNRCLLNLMKKNIGEKRYFA